MKQLNELIERIFIYCKENNISIISRIILVINKNNQLSINKLFYNFLEQIPELVSEKTKIELNYDDINTCDIKLIE